MVQTRDIEARNADSLRKISAQSDDPAPFFGYVDVKFLPGAPFVMFNNGDDSVANEILTKGEFEAGSMRLWVDLCRRATCALDVGAYTGIFALAAASTRSDLPIHAFEPNPYSCARLRVNKCVNQAWNITDHNYGIAHSAMISELRWRAKQGISLPSNATLAQLPIDPKHVETAVVRLHPLTDALVPSGLGAHPIMKIDVEGAEALVFQGLHGVLQHRPDIILETFDPRACAEIGAILTPLGYRFGKIDEDTGAIEPQPQLIPSDPASKNRNHFLTAR